MTEKILHYTKIPNRLFYSTVKEEVSILADNNFNYKTLFILDYLYMNTNKRSIINFHLKDMINECGFKYSSKKGESSDQFKMILTRLKEIGIINSSSDFSVVKSNDLIACTLEINYSSKYFQLYDFEKLKIIHQSLHKSDNMKLLVYYCYLKCRMYKRSKTDKIVENGGRAEVCFPSYELIHTDIGITDETINKYNTILVELNLIRIGNAGFWYYKNDTNESLKESCNIYTLYSDEISTKNNLKEGIRYWMSLDINSNKIFTGSREYKNNNRQLYGEYGSIAKKIIHGTATDEDIARKDEILSSTKPNEGQYRIKALLASNEGGLLSDIYYSMGKNEIAWEAFELEESLGLVDRDSNRLVDYSYYKWVMKNYEQDKHEYYVNCIKKKRKEEPSVEGFPISQSMKQNNIAEVVAPDIHKTPSNNNGSNPFSGTEYNPFTGEEQKVNQEVSKAENAERVQDLEERKREWELENNKNVKIIIRKVQAEKQDLVSKAKTEGDNLKPFVKATSSEGSPVSKSKLFEGLEDKNPGVFNSNIPKEFYEKAVDVFIREDLKTKEKKYMNNQLDENGFYDLEKLIEKEDKAG